MTLKEKKSKSQKKLSSPSKASPKTKGKEFGEDMGSDILLVMAIIGIVAVFFSSPDFFKKSSIRSAQLRKSHYQSSHIDHYLNQQMQNAAIKMDIDSQKVRLENQRSAPSISQNDYIPEWQNSKTSLFRENVGYVNEVPEDLAGRVYRDVSAEKKEYETSINPMAKINAIIESKKYIREYDRKKREEYVRQVMENAERDGFQISINDQLEIVRVQPISTDRPLRLPARNAVSSKINHRPNPLDPTEESLYSY